MAKNMTQSKKDPKSAVAERKDDDVSGGIDRIRDILFGAQMSDYELRFKRLEESLKSESNSMHDRIEKRFLSLQQSLQEQFGNLKELLQKEQEARSKALEQAEAHQARTTKTLEQTIQKLREDLNRSIDQVGSRLEDRSKTLKSDMKSDYEELRRMLEGHFQELSSNKADRATLATLLTDLAGNLSATQPSKKNN